MAIQAGFAEVDITPLMGTEKVGWLNYLVVDTVADPIYARAMVLESGGSRVVFLALDILSVTWSQVCRIRSIAESVGIPGANLMVAATHNHAGPATCTVGPTTRDEAYVETMMQRIEQALRNALESLTPAKIAIGSTIEGRLSFIRRFIMKDGRVCTHPPGMSPDIRCAEGVKDPEVGVLCVKDLDGKVLGFLVNFACHPTHHGGDTCISAGYPGQLSLALKGTFGEGCVTVFANGAFGNIHYTDPLIPEWTGEMDRMGAILAQDVADLLPRMEFTEEVPLSVKTRDLDLPIRDPEGPYGINYPYQQPFGAAGVYAKDRERLREEIARCPAIRAHVQCIRVGDRSAFVSIPAEYFSQMGLKIKMESLIPQTFVLGAANGMVGYVPHREAFERGGYETTFAGWSMVAPEAADMLAGAALELVGRRQS